MSGLKQNRFLVIYLVVVVLGAGGLGYLLYQTKSELDAVSQEYDDTAKKLQDLQARKPFPNDANLKQLKELQAQYATEIRTLATELNKQTPQLKEVSPQAFQDQLREIVSSVTKKAQDKGTKLPTGFYMGFDRYKNSPPSAAAAPLLSRQLDVIAGVVNKMLQFKVREIGSIIRKELPEESAAPAGAAASAKKLVSYYPFEIIFDADQDNLRHLFNSIITAEQFYIIRSFEILNSQPVGPSKKEDASRNPGGRNRQRNRAAENAPAASSPGTAAPAPGTPAGPEAAAAENSMRVIVGQEYLRVALKIEQICFDIPEIK